MELLITALSKIISNHFLAILLEGPNHEQSSQNTYLNGSPPQSMGGIFFPKKLFMCNILLWEKIMGKLFEMGGLMIRWCKGGGGVS